MVMSATNSKILVVDDDATVRELVKALLCQNGYDVREAPDGEIALASLADDPVDIVLIDILMPRKEGLETIIELKQGFPNLVVFAMSASGARKGHDFLSIAAKFGADGILQKPFSPDELLALIASRSTLTRSAGLAPLVGR
jgi:DNA-binding response OmpR family regulator